MSAEAARQDPPAAAKAENQAPPVFLMDGTRTNGGTRKITPHDFRNPAAVPQTDLRVIETQYQSYTQILAPRISTSLRMECGLKVAKVTSLPFSELCATILDPSCITLFGVEAMRGVGVLGIDSLLALAMADRLLGGKGRAPAAERMLTEIEMTLMEDPIQTILASWLELWIQGAEGSGLRILGHETSARCLPAPIGNEIFVTVELELSMGETAGPLLLAVPFSMVEQAVGKIKESRKRAADRKPPKQVQWRNQYAGIEVPAVAEWKIREMPLVETLHMRQGDVIELPNSLINQACLRVSEGASFIGSVGIQNGNVAIQITGPDNKA